MPPLGQHSPANGSGGGSAPDGRLAMRRRDALKLFASGLALAVAGCSRPNEETYRSDLIVPYVDMPEGMAAGEPQYYATALPLAGYGRGALVKSIDGRPIKIEGNPRHPASLGSTDIFMQAEILSLYDPDRSQTVRGPQPVQTWETFAEALARQMAALEQGGGAGLHLVTGRITSPTLLGQIGKLLDRYPQARWHAYEPAEGDLAGAQRRQRPQLDQADIVVSLDADPLGPGPDQVADGRAFAARRDPAAQAGVSRVYVLESSRTLTGANADHRLSMPPAAIEAFARALLARLPGGNGEAARSGPTPEAERLLSAVVADVTRPGVRTAILAGETLPADLRESITAANRQLGVPSVVTASAERQRNLAPLDDLWSALEGGEVTHLVILDRNPLHDFPDPKLKSAMGNVPFSIHAGMIEDETGQLCRWHLPLSHVLESWSDIAASDGTRSIIQPLIRPLYASETAHQIVARLDGDPAPSGHDIIRAAWRDGRSDQDFEDWWRTTLTAGVIKPGSDETGSGQPGAAQHTVVGQPGATPAPEEAVAVSASAESGPPTGPGSFTAVIRPDPTIYDGTRAGNAWLQECPKPIAKNTWTNVVALSPGDAGRLGVDPGDVVEVKSTEGSMSGPVHIDAGQADGIVGLTLGYGRSAAGAIGTGLGYNARQLSPHRVASRIEGVGVAAAGRRDPVPSTQQQFRLEGELARLMPMVNAASGFEVDSAARPATGQHFNHPERRSDGYSWAMVIDNAACIGCNACVVACQAENNIPVVGPEEVANHRIMQWIRIDRYERDAESPSCVGGFEPVPCMQCEKAPCEPVCPVEASVHDVEGINNQVYNRCVGTRFCQSNCPYKVRRFNWFAYGSGQEYKNLGHEPMPAQKNPDVTVRARGVMEKCTYCVQRISRARHQAEKTDRPIAEGEVLTACQQACPTQAIHFGNLQDLASQVGKLRSDPRHFTLLEELGTAPRTTYLARLRNPNPHLDEKST